MTGGDASDYTSANRSTYDRIASRYAANRSRAATTNDVGFADLQRAFIDTLQPGGLIADLGCGPAIDGARLAGAGFRVVGIDLSHGMLSIASKALDGLVAQGDLQAIPLADGLLDGIWCAAALLHVPEPDTDKVLQEFRRTVRRSGSLALVTALGEGSRFETVPYAAEEQRWFVYRNAERLRDQVFAAGFRVSMQNVISGNRVWYALLAEAK